MDLDSREFCAILLPELVQNEEVTGRCAIREQTEPEPREELLLHRQPHEAHGDLRESVDHPTDKDDHHDHHQRLEDLPRRVVLS